MTGGLLHIKIKGELALVVFTPMFQYDALNERLSFIDLLNKIQIVGGVKLLFNECDFTKNNLLYTFDKYKEA